MRNVLLLVVGFGCGGSTPPPQPPPSNAVPTAETPATPTSGLTKEVCSQRKDELGPVALRADQVELRRGTGAKTFAEITTSKSAPIEVCMPPGEQEWLASVTCSDGSKPTEIRRSGSVGPGGTCGSILDLYNVTCPDTRYEVYMDMYMCPPDAGLQPTVRLHRTIKLRSS